MLVTLSSFGVVLSVLTLPVVEYTPLSREAALQGTLPALAEPPQATHRLVLGGLTLEAELPAAGAAYGLAPLRYRLTGTAPGARMVAVQATAFEEPERRGDRALYDLALPGRMEVKLEYLGSQTGVFDASRVTRLSRHSRHETFPPYTLRPLVRAATVEQGSYLWFKFRVTNTGDTILDPEGYGGWMTRLLVYREDADGRRTQVAEPINQVHRPLEYLYPGESVEHWFDVWTAGAPWERLRTLPEGRLIVAYDLLYRYYGEYNWIVNMWQGKPWRRLEVPIEVVAVAPAAPAPVAPLELAMEPPDQRRAVSYFSRFEEFMTSFDTFHAAGDGPVSLDGAWRTLYVQVAPWTKALTLKLLTDEPGALATATAALRVDVSGLAVRDNPDNPFVFVDERGARSGWIYTQAMPAMRSTHQLGPHPERHLRERLREMKALGINLIASTGGSWHLNEIAQPDGFVGDIHAETFKHYFDVITREEKMPVLGWGVFPPKTQAAVALGGYYYGETPAIALHAVGRTYSHLPEVDVGHPDFPRLYAGAILFNYERWGDQWARTRDGDLLIDVEDTWGWLRDDIHLRYGLGPHALARFRAWAQARYGTIEAANEVWNATYASFDEVDPQQGQVHEAVIDDIVLPNVGPEYTNPAHPFHDWSPAVEDWDRFRTELRCAIYDEIQERLREKICGAHIDLRTEGANILADVPATATAPHLRHIHYSLRRCALLPEVLAASKTFAYHSDYTTLPYSETELRALLRAMREQGRRGLYLPQFDRMRDMLLNEHYGRPWQVHYNLPAPRKALQVACLTAAFPWWRIIWEEGHCPGVLWEDYLCDGFVTETQKKELVLFRRALDAATKQH